MLTLVKVKGTKRKLRFAVKQRQRNTNLEVAKVLGKLSMKAITLLCR
jgi:hypothetical protein